jgi:hypothetical protein
MKIDIIVDAYEGKSVHKDMKSFIPGHEVSKDFIFVGQAPSSMEHPVRGASFTRVKAWADVAKIYSWDFQNAVPHIVNCDDRNKIEYALLYKRVNPFKKVVALGNFASDALRKINIRHLKILHPSPRNRSLNNFEVELEQIRKLREYYRK